nr:transposase [Halonatronum saccharophilum]
MDMWTPYKSAIEEVFPHAKIVVDKFHIVALINNALDSVRKSEQFKLGKTNRRKFYKSRLTITKTW